MARPSITATPEGIQLARQVLIQRGWTQNYLREVVQCSRQPITNFFKGEPIAQSIFIQLCDRLNLDWQLVAGIHQTAITASLPTGADTNSLVQQLPAQGDVSLPDVTTLIQELRHWVYDTIEERCGTMRILDMSYPIGIEDIYTDVNILEQISGRKRKKLEELLQTVEMEEFDRLGLGQITEERVSGMEAVKKYHRLIILGKPGAGKTTFLKHLAIQCNQG